jgi:glutamyl-tRNA synthetase
MTIVTRFAPSPTGFLHIGSARTALFNYLFAKRHGGKFLLRIEDTDRQRSSKEATDALLSGLKWLGINWDAFSDTENEVYQSKRSKRHQEIAFELLKNGKAYKCFVSAEEIKAQKDQAVAEGRSFLFSSPWRDLNEDQHPQNQPYVIRFKTPRIGVTVIHDLIHGEVKFANDTIEDIVLLKSDLEPLYNLCVCVDDYDMGVTHIIRGDDHFTNAARQTLLYEAMGWKVPYMAHMPLIHGDDGTKLSKRHGATNVEDYKFLGYLPEALVNYILHLGWSYQGEEIISMEEAGKIFDLSHVGKSCSRIDFDKMRNVNAQYIRHADDNYLVGLVVQSLKSANLTVSDEDQRFILNGMKGLKVRANLISELAEHAKIYLTGYQPKFTDEAINILQQTKRGFFEDVVKAIENISELNYENIQSAFKELAASKKLKLGELMQPIRCLLTGSVSSPSVFEIIEVIGKDHCINKIKKFL